MFHPVGSQPPSVYWRRRVLLVGTLVAVVALIGLTLHVLASSDTPKAGAAGTTSSTASHSSTPRPSPTAASTKTTPTRTASSSTQTSSSPHTTVSSSAPPAKCDVQKLTLAAAAGNTSYKVGDKPVLSIVVTNPSATPCAQDLGDPQIVLRVYNGESRVWGSHDCMVVPGADVRTLMGNQSVRVSITWSGLSSQPNCAGTRQQVGAGTYTVYASLGGREGKAAQFSFS